MKYVFRYIKIFFVYGDILAVSAITCYIFQKPVPIITYICCLSLSILSIILWVISRIQLGDSFALRPRARNLVQSGIYARIRNPIYFFSSMVLLGDVIYLHQIFGYMFFICLVVLQSVRTKKEEQILYEKFGEKYLEYKAKTWF